MRKFKGIEIFTPSGIKSYFIGVAGVKRISPCDKYIEVEGNETLRIFRNVSYCVILTKQPKKEKNI